MSYLKKTLTKPLVIAGIIILILCIAYPLVSIEENYYGFEMYNHSMSIEKNKYYGLKESVFPPELIEPTNVVKYEFHYKNRLITNNPSYQIYLEYNLFEQDLENEMNRLKSLNLNYDTVNYIYPCVVSVLDNEKVWEYALINLEENKLIYIYLQNTNIRDINFNIDYLPSNYSKLFTINK